MKKFIIIISIILAIITLSACNSKPEDDIPKIDGWLFMMYVGGDCNLEGPLWGDVNEMEKGLYDLEQKMPEVAKNVKIVVLWDGIKGESSLSPTGARLYELGADGVENQSLSGGTKDLTSSGKWWSGDEVNMADGKNVTEFLNWSKKTYPSYKYQMLMLSDHGGGARNRGKAHTRGAIWDDSSGGEKNFIETKELTKAIADAGFTGENKLSVLGFDACLMAALEEAYNHRTVAEYYVASLETEQGDGWEYNHWIPQLIEGTTPEELGTILVKSYHDSFVGIGGSFFGPDQTLSCTNLNKIESLKTALDELGGAIINTGSIDTYKSKFESSTSFYGTWSKLYEIGNFIEKLESTAVSGKANAVKEAMKEVIVYSWADSNSGNYYEEGQNTYKGLSLVGDCSDEFTYSIDIFDFADGDWAELHHQWYNSN